MYFRLFCINALADRFQQLAHQPAVAHIQRPYIPMMLGASSQRFGARQVFKGARGAASLHPDAIRIFYHFHTFVCLFIIN